MKKKNKIFTLGVGVFVSMLTLTLAGCGIAPAPVTSSVGGDSGNPGTSSVTSTPGTGESSISSVEETGIFETKSIVNDLELDADGQPVFEDEVSIKMWSIIGDPDQVVFDKLVRQFNDEYMGMIHIDLEYKGHFDYYSALENQWTYEPDLFPDVCFMHNEKTVEYAYKGYLYPLDTLFEKTGVTMDFDQIYSNIDRVTQYQNHRFAVPVDAHGFVTSFRQDIIKKNGLGFDNNTRYIPNSRAEYDQLLRGLRAKADAGELLTRTLDRGSDHSWRTASPMMFYPSFTQSTDPDGLSALYANGGRLLNDAQDTVTFHENIGFQTYLTDQVERYNSKLTGEPGTAIESFNNGNIVMFSEGPWYVAQTFSPRFNNSELSQVGKGITEEEANDPVYAKPYVASRPTSWWTTDDYKNAESGTKWYGNGHAVSITRHCKKLSQVAAALTFMKWYTQGKQETKENGEVYNLATWCTAGHMPAWKNVYESDYYQELTKTHVTCKAFGSPENIIAMEGLEYETTVFQSISDACNQVISALKSAAGCTKEKAIEILNQTAESCQDMLDIYKM